jgi:DNA-binding SARP family transcriptional activator
MTVGQPQDTVVGAKVRVPRVTALVRERLNNTLDGVWQHRLGLVVAPAGSGKTTALAQFAATVDAPVAWYRAEAAEAGDPRLLFAYLERALTAALGPLEGGWDSLERALAALERWPGRRALLVVDDLHVLAASEGEQLLGRLVDYAPPALTVLVGSRSAPRLNLSRLRLAGGLLELGADDLRFRSWEVEHLFHDFYREPLPPEDMASLARRTEGWAAGLQLFHLAASLAVLGMARLGRPGAREYALHAEAGARPAGVRGAQVPALLASAITGAEHAAEHLDLAMALATECGLDTDRLLRGLPELWPSARSEPVTATAQPPRPTVRCLGGFELRLDGEPVALGSLKPRCQALLRLLAMYGGRPVHREALIDALWPNADQAAGMRGLQVAVSTLRRFLEPDAGRGEASLLVREGQTYRLALPEPTDADVVAFSRALVEARAATATGEARTAERALERALDAYGGDLLPEDGPAEWVVGEREHFRAEAAEAAATLAALQLARDAAMSAAATCKRGLAIDHYRDPLWRLLVDAYEHAGEYAAAEKARRGYSAMLAELGLADDRPRAASLP